MKCGDCLRVEPRLPGCGHNTGGGGSTKTRQKKKDANAISEKQTTEVGDRLYKSSKRRGEMEGDWCVELDEGREVQETGSPTPLMLSSPSLSIRLLEVMFGLKALSPCRQ